MTEDDAQAWVSSRFGAGARAKLGRYVDLILSEASRQNLIARSTHDSVWSRHIVDSLQLLSFSPSSPGRLWIDVGSGAGLPGMAVAAASGWQMILVEPRRLRVEFLKQCAAELAIENRVTVVQGTAERFVAPPAGVISARAVANLSEIFAKCVHLSDAETCWLLPKGAGANSEVESARSKWQGAFHVKQSLIDPASGIVVAQGVSAR